MGDQPPPAAESLERRVFKHIPHARIAERQAEKPPTVQEERDKLGFNGRVGVFITSIVGTMWTAYLFTFLALLSLPAVLTQANFVPAGTFPSWLIAVGLIALVAWVAQTFIQLVLLPIIIVGQNVQASASDKRAIQTYKDAEAILAECLQLQDHLQKQDEILDRLVSRLESVPGGGPL